MTSGLSGDAKDEEFNAMATAPTLEPPSFPPATDVKGADSADQTRSQPCMHNLRTDVDSDIIIRTQEEFMAVAQARLDVDNDTFSELHGPLTSYYAAMVVYLDDYARHKASFWQKQTSENRRTVEWSRKMSEEARSTLLKTSLGSLEQIVTAIWSKEKSRQGGKSKESDGKTPEVADIMNKQLVESEKTITDLRQKLKMAEVRVKNSTTEAEKAKKEKEWQQKAAEEQQRKLKGSFSQKVEERASRRVREEHTTLTERLQAAELKAHKHDEAAVTVVELEKQIKDLTHEKTALQATKSRFGTECRSLKENNEAIQEGYAQVRQEKEEADLRNMELEEELVTVTADRDTLKEVLARKVWNEVAVSEEGTSACVQPIANMGHMTELDRTRRIKEDLQNQLNRLQAEQKAYDERLEDVEGRIALREVDLAEVKGEKEPTQGKREPLFELDHTNSHEQSGESWGQEELSAKPVVSIARRSAFIPQCGLTRC